jgi:calcium-dependent protein kinase
VTEEVIQSFSPCLFITGRALFSANRLIAISLASWQMALPISVEDVRREVKILETLSGHENVVQFIASFEDDDLVYIVME